MLKKLCFKNGWQAGTERGQGLVEYAMILVMVAVVVVVVLALMGPAVGRVFSQVDFALTNPGFTGTTVRNGNDITITITVSRTSTLAVRDMQSGHTWNPTCSGTCSHTFTCIPNPGSISVTINGKTISIPYQ